MEIVKKLSLFLAAGCLLPFVTGQAPYAVRKTAEEMARKKAEYQKEHPPRESVGTIPLTDLGNGSYKGEQGGLYPGGENVVPAEHLKAGLKLAGMVSRAMRKETRRQTAGSRRSPLASPTRASSSEPS